MSIYMSFISQSNAPKVPVQIGKLAKQQFSQLKFNNAMENTLGHTSKDFFNLTHPVKPNNTVAKQNISFVQGLKSFFERGTMF